ncbi:MAG: lipase family protein [Myxococcaceae bacterium]
MSAALASAAPATTNSDALVSLTANTLTANTPQDEKTAALNAVATDALTSITRGPSNAREGSPFRAEPEPNTPGFSLRNANATAHLAMFADADKETLEKNLSRWGFDASTLHLFADRATDAQGFAVADPAGNIYVSYLGTTSLPDLMTDLSMKLIAPEWSSARGLRVHNGFDTDFNGVWSQVEDLINEIRRKVGDKGTLFLTGHSMGGALAELSALRARGLWNVAPEKLQVYTFGAPRVGNETYAETYNTQVPRTFSVVTQHSNWRDPISNFPPRWLGYRETGETVLLGDNGQIEPGAPERSGNWDWLPLPYLEQRFEIHRMSSYLDRIERADAVASAAA